MRLQGVELVKLDLVLREPVGTATGVHSARPVVFVRVVTEECEGWGECAALHEGTSVDPPVDTVQAALAAWGIERLLAASAARHGELPDAATVARLYNADPLARLVSAVIEMAVLDAELHLSGRSLVTRLGASPGPVRVGAVAGIPEDRRVATLVGHVGSLVARGLARVRLKIEPGWDLWPVKAVVEAFPSLSVQVDANGSYRLETDGEDAADRLKALDPFALTCIEQPLAPADLPGHALLARRIATPICLDESLTSLRRLADALGMGACSVACVKPARLGGLFAARRAEILCREAGIDAFVGGFFEAGLARSANAALGALAGFTLPGDLGDPGEYLEADPCGYPAVVRGLVVPPSAAGVGPAPKETSLGASDAERTWFSFEG